MDKLHTCEEVAVLLGVTPQRVSQIELRALAKIHVLSQEDDVEALEPEELRLLIQHCRNALLKHPLHPQLINEYASQGCRHRNLPRR